MTGCRIPGFADAKSVGPIDAGTACLWATPPPGPLMLCEVERGLERREHRQSVPGGFFPAFMTLSVEAIGFLKKVEALFLQPYDDQTSEITESWVRGATIGYGHLIAEADWPKFQGGITEEDATALLAADLAPFENTVGACITARLQQYEFDALVILAFNIGKRAFQGSAVVKLVNNAKAKTAFSGLEEAWKAWNKSQGQVMRGLDNRRNAEWKIYTMATYERW